MPDALPLLQLPSGRTGKFELDLLTLMATNGFFHERNDGAWQIRHRKAVGAAFVTLQPKSLAQACNAIARFASTDGKVVPLPNAHSLLLLQSTHIGRLPREWRQIRQFLGECGGSFKAYIAWCDDQGLVPVVDSPGRFRTAISNIKKADGK